MKTLVVCILLALLGGCMTKTVSLGPGDFYVVKEGETVIISVDKESNPIDEAEDAELSFRHYNKH